MQDVAVKIMHEADDEQLAQFEKVFSMQMNWISCWVLFRQKKPSTSVLAATQLHEARSML